MTVDEITRFIEDRINLPPGLPADHPTKARWQEPPNPHVSSAQSASLPSEIDIIIIGSGITGCSTALTLLSHPSANDLNITVLEAREACSGATGRNGGHLVSDVHGEHSNFSELGSLAEAEKILRFSEANIARLQEVVVGLSEADREAAELRLVNSSMGYANNELFEQAKQSIAAVENAIPRQILSHVVISKDEAKKDFKYRDVVGGLGQIGAGVLWPYRLITALWKNMLEDHKGRFSLETNTPVTAIDFHRATSLYAVTTPRGTILAKKVIHCTNGWTGHLNPNLIGKIYPWRGTMSAQKPGPAFPTLGDKVAWSYLGPAALDRESHVMTGGLYYAQQNAKSGDIFIGGEVSKLEDIFTADDSKIGATTKQNLSTILPRLWDDVDEKPEAQIWSGIMGWTSDGMPLVGKLDSKLSGREGGGEWIAAGFNGHGMNKCWMTGEAIARMALGEDVPNWFPGSYILSEARSEKLSARAAAERLVSWFP